MFLHTLNKCVSLSAQKIGRDALRPRVSPNPNGIITPFLSFFYPFLLRSFHLRVSMQVSIIRRKMHQNIFIHTFIRISHPYFYVRPSDRIHTLFILRSCGACNIRILSRRWPAVFFRSGIIHYIFWCFSISVCFLRPDSENNSFVLPTFITIYYFIV